MTEDYTSVFTAQTGLHVDLQMREESPREGATPKRWFRLITGTGRGAVVIATRRDGGQEQILLVRSFRPAAEQWFWELPRGWAEPEEVHEGINTYVEAALRELFEETGKSAREPVLLGEYVTDTAVYPQCVGVVRCATTNAPDSPTDGEVAAVRWTAAGDIHGLIRSGEIRDAHSLAAFALWAAYGSESK